MTGINGNGYTVKEIIEKVWKDVRQIGADVKEIREQHDIRIRSNEKKISWIYGALGILGITITLIIRFG